MGERIEDGSGKGNEAKVDSRLRLHTDSTSRTQLEQAALIGQAYNFSTGVINLTTDGESALGYIKYNGDLPLEFKEIGVRLGDSSNGSGDAVIKIVSLPDAGTIIDNADPAPAVGNRDILETRPLDALVYKGDEGYTLTGGSNFAITSRSTFVEPVLFDAGPIILRKGATLGILVTPPAGNTSQSVVVFGTGFVETADYNGTGG
jgi:hypothetical protein